MLGCRWIGCVQCGCLTSMLITCWACLAFWLPGQQTSRRCWQVPNSLSSECFRTAVQRPCKDLTEDICMFSYQLRGYAGQLLQWDGCGKRVQWILS